MPWPKSTAACRVTGWERWRGNIWRAPVPKGRRFFNLIVDGHSATMAQTPNAGSGFGGGAKPVGPAETWKPREHVFVPESWRGYDYDDAQVYAFHDSNWFSEMHEILQPPDAEGLMLVTKGNIGPRLFIRGVLEFLDEPGEWCLKNKEGFVYYWPKSGTPVEKVIIRPTCRKVSHHPRQFVRHAGEEHHDREPIDHRFRLQQGLDAGGGQHLAQSAGHDLRRERRGAGRPELPPAGRRPFRRHAQPSRAELRDRQQPDHGSRASSAST